jgi:hypothetical protein
MKLSSLLSRYVVKVHLIKTAFCHISFDIVKIKLGSDPNQETTLYLYKHISTEGESHESKHDTFDISMKNQPPLRIGDVLEINIKRVFDKKATLTTICDDLRYLV